MELDSNKWIFKGLVVTLAASFLGCSEVSFEPGPTLNSDFSLPDDPATGGGNNVGGQYKMDSFTQRTGSPRTDILIIIDNSMSMQDEQKKMGERMANFLDHLSDIDWRLAITTTDVSDGRYGLQGAFLPFGSQGIVLSKNVPRYNELFLQAVVRKETAECAPRACNVSGDEQPLAATIMSITRYATANIDFFRPDADLSVVYLSDEDEMSDGPNKATKPKAVIDAVKTVWKGGKNLTAYGIVIEPGDLACLKNQGDFGGYYGQHVADLALLTGGITGSICNNDYSETLSIMGKKVRDTVVAYKLSAVPDAATVKVKLNPEQGDVTWRLEGSKVIFNRLPAYGTQISVEYITR